MIHDQSGEIDLQLQKLKQSILDVMSHQKSNLRKQPYSFNNQLNQKLKNAEGFSESNKEIDVLEMGDYLKLLCHQKKYLSEKRAQKVKELNESLLIEQENYKHLFMISSQASYFKLEYPGYYDQLLSQLPLYPKNMFSAIQKDIHRTFPNEHPFQQSLRNVLIAFAIRNPNLLYCQGMNYLVAYFLINSVSDDETFWIMSCLVQNILPHDYFRDLSTISITTQIFSDVLPYLFPDMAREMKNIGMDYSLFIVSWYVCLFTKGFINSVSAYLLTKLILEKRKHSLGFVLLKLSLGVIAAILGRDEPFMFKPEFSAFRDKFEQSVFEISLLEIKLGVEYVELNEENYLKLQKYYRQKRQTRHSQALSKDIKSKRLTLPLCSPDYPICLHRIQIERKLGNISQVTINRNGYQIAEQYIEDYFDNEPKIQTKSSTYIKIQDCLMYRHHHVCQMDLFNGSDCSDLSEKLEGKVSLRHDESFVMEKQRLQTLQDCFSSVEIQFRNAIEKDDDKFRELSGYFVVDEEFKFGSEEDVEEIQKDNQQQTADNLKKPLNIGSSSSVDEPFSLAKQLQKHQIQQDWIKNEQEFKTLEEIQRLSLESSLHQGKTSKQMVSLNNLSKKNKNQLGQKTITDTNLNISKGQNNFFNKEKIWNFFGKTWKKVTKIKQEQLQN